MLSLLAVSTGVLLLAACASDDAPESEGLAGYTSSHSSVVAFDRQVQHRMVSAPQRAAWNTDRYDSITVADYLESRFDDRRHVLRILSAVVIFSMVTAYTAAQLTAAGKAFASFLDISYVAGALIGAWIGAHFAGSLGGLTLRRLFACVLLVVATKMLISK